MQKILAFFVLCDTIITSRGNRGRETITGPARYSANENDYHSKF
ncbi:hypothetical protein [Escherichia phage FFH2]|uniref:Uncharacterized protein n=1 Tax=Escherichia phage FFH2 TaxID=1446490 RepID=A0A023MHC8_9CAUD|nr:hypothetical protein FG37_gp104 [Escherichia phage FFH2]AHN83770.1 hypothetical protein [Escherichia phage FFH2]